MVLSKPVKPTPQRVKKPLIDKAVGKICDDRAKVDEIDKNKSNEASSAKVDEVDKTNAEIVEPKDDKSDTVAKSAESQDDNVAKSERDEASEAKTDAVAESKNGEIPQERGPKADVEQATEAPQQRQQQQLSCATVCAPEHDATQCVQKRTAEQVIDVLDDAGTSAQQRTVETAVHRLDKEPLDETQRVVGPVRAKAAPAHGGSLSRTV